MYYDQTELLIPTAPKSAVLPVFLVNGTTIHLLFWQPKRYYWNDTESCHSPAQNLPVASHTHRIQLFHLTSPPTSLWLTHSPLDTLISLMNPPACITYSFTSFKSLQTPPNPPRGLSWSPYTRVSPSPLLSSVLALLFFRALISILHYMFLCICLCNICLPHWNYITLAPCYISSTHNSSTSLKMKML